MDPNAGRFIEEGRAGAWMERIAVGEIVKIKGEEFEVLGFNDRKIVLKLLSAEDRFQERLSATGTAAAMPGFEELIDTISECERQRKKMLKYQR